MFQTGFPKYFIKIVKKMEWLFGTHKKLEYSQKCIKQSKTIKNTNTTFKSFTIQEFEFLCFWKCDMNFYLLSKVFIK